MALTLHEAIARVPFLADAKNVVTAPLTGGVTNLNFKIDAEGKSYVLRIAGADTDKLGIRRDVEYAANLAAGRLGIAPEVIYYHRAGRLPRHTVHQGKSHAARSNHAAGKYYARGAQIAALPSKRPRT